MRSNGGPGPRCRRQWSWLCRPNRAGWHRRGARRNRRRLRQRPGCLRCRRSRGRSCALQLGSVESGKDGFKSRLERARLGEHGEQLRERPHDFGGPRRQASVRGMRKLIDVDADALQLGNRGGIGERDPGRLRQGLLLWRCGGPGRPRLAREGFLHGRCDEAAHGGSCAHGGLLDGLALLDRDAQGDHGCLGCLTAHGASSFVSSLQSAASAYAPSVPSTSDDTELKTASAFTIPHLATRAAGIKNRIAPPVRHIAPTLHQHLHQPAPQPRPNTTPAPSGHAITPLGCCVLRFSRYSDFR